MKTHWYYGLSRCAAGLILCSATTARAADALNSSGGVEGAKPAVVARGPKSPPKPKPHTEFNIVPVAGGSTDLGFGGGYFVGLARIKPGFEPFLWNVDSSGLITFKHSRVGGLTEGFTVPYRDFYARLTIPRLFGSPVRLEIRPSYTWEQIDYFGMGNASSRAAVDDNPNPDYSKYERGHPQFDVDLRTRLVDHLAGRLGFRYIYNVIRVAQDSSLTRDLSTGSSEVKSLIGDTRSHSVALFKYGLQWDTRDNETSSHRGTFDTADLKLSPGGTPEFPHRYGEGTLNLRAFVPLGSRRVVLAVRAVGDMMFGDVPFYELARFDDTFALGGTSGVRGVPAQRYYGKAKAFGNVELRLEALSFKALGKQLILGVVPFVDAGRVWADTAFHPELDGRGLGLKYGAGAGLRLQSGSAFVLRLDVAGSPDAKPVSGYFSAGQAF